MKNSNLSPSCFKRLKNIRYHSLWFETRKYFALKQKLMWNQVNWFRVLLLYREDYLHIHIVKILQSAWNYSWDSLWTSHWYLESWMHSGWALQWISIVCRGQWIGVDCPCNGDERSSSIKHYWEFNEEKAFLWLKIWSLALQRKLKRTAFKAKFKSNW